MKFNHQQMAVVGNRHTGWHVLLFAQRLALSTHVALHPSARKASPSCLKLAIDLSPGTMTFQLFFGRDISRFHKFASLWYGDSPKLIKSVPLSKVSFNRLSRHVQADILTNIVCPDSSQDSLPNWLSSYSQRGPDEAYRFICPGSRELPWCPKNQSFIGRYVVPQSSRLC